MDREGSDAPGGKIPLHATTWELDRAEGGYINDLKATHVTPLADPRIEVPDVEVVGDPDADVLVLGWGSTWGAITSGVRRLTRVGHKVAQVHLTHLNPLPENLGEVLRRHRKILVPEMNMGQLLLIIRAEFLVDAVGFNKIQGQPFKISELVDKIEEVLAS